MEKIFKTREEYREYQLQQKLAERRCEDMSYFRGKAIEEHCSNADKNGWVYGSLINTEEYNKKQTRSIFRIRHFGFCIDDDGVDIETVGRYIGRKTRDSMVFEGDIIEHTYESFENDRHGEIITERLLIYWDEYYCAFRCQNVEKVCPSKEILGQEQFEDDVEIIGNKWDNPELLECEEKHDHLQQITPRLEPTEPIVIKPVWIVEIKVARGAWVDDPACLVFSTKEEAKQQARKARKYYPWYKRWMRVVRVVESTTEAKIKRKKEMLV